MNKQTKKYLRTTLTEIYIIASAIMINNLLVQYGIISKFSGGTIFGALILVFILVFIGVYLRENWNL